jgi:invasion protein IalB
MVRIEAAHGLTARLLCILVAVGLPVACAASGDANASELIYSPWDKFCFNNLDCFVGRDVRLATKCNPVVAAAVLIERTGESKKTLRVTVRNDVRLEDGVRISIDGKQPVSRPFEECFPNGFPNVCAADVEAGAELVDRLKNGTMLVIEATSAAGALLTYRLPLGGFAQAYDGPPREPMVFEQQSGRLEKELQERAEGKQSPQEKKKVECEAEHG